MVISASTTPRAETWLSASLPLHPRLSKPPWSCRCRRWKRNWMPVNRTEPAGKCISPMKTADHVRYVCELIAASPKKYHIHLFSFNPTASNESKTQSQFLLGLPDLPGPHEEPEGSLQVLAFNALGTRHSHSRPRSRCSLEERRGTSSTTQRTPSLYQLPGLRPRPPPSRLSLTRPKDPHLPLLPQGFLAKCPRKTRLLW